MREYDFNMIERPQVPPKEHKRPGDTNQLAKRIVDIPPGDKEDRKPPQEQGKDPTASAASPSRGKRK